MSRWWDTKGHSLQWAAGSKEILKELSDLEECADHLDAIFPGSKAALATRRIVSLCHLAIVESGRDGLGQIWYALGHDLENNVREKDIKERSNEGKTFPDGKPWGPSVRDLVEAFDENAQAIPHATQLRRVQIALDDARELVAELEDIRMYLGEP